MGNIVEISEEYEPVISLALDTIKKNKQALVFVNTKRSAEHVAEKISKKIKQTGKELEELSEKAGKALSRPTRQCERLSGILKKGIAFHHAGLHSKQKELIEENFRKGIIKIICCTPTLAAGLDLPAFRTIIRDVRRFGISGMAYIPVLEYLQMAGRAGRPKFDSYGEAVLIANSEGEKDNLQMNYVEGEPEEIYSKLAVEPVLRTYLLSLIASGIVRTKQQILGFFERTFWAHQFKDMEKLERIINKTIRNLLEWGFVSTADESFRATILGKRTAELYLDPLTARKLLVGAHHAPNVSKKPVSWLHLIASTLEMRPYLRIRAKEFDVIQEELAKVEHNLLEKEPNPFEPEYDDWLNGFKTALMLNDWIEEKDEEYLLDKYNIRPGETRAKLSTADWLLYALSELCRISELQSLLKDITRMRLRVKYGVKEELLPLLKFESIGRVRARTLFRNNIKDIGDVRKAPLEKLNSLLGIKTAKKIKEQVGE